MKILKSLLGRRQFLIAAGVTSTSTLVFKKLTKLVDPLFKTSIASAAESKANNIKKLGKPKCVIIYFSCTGNTEIIAKAIHKGVVQAAGSCDILPIKEANPLRLEGYDLIGFGNAIQGAIKRNVYEFTQKIRYVGGKHLFLFSTSHSGGNNFGTLVPLFKERGLTFIGGRAYKGAEYGPLGEPCPVASDGHPDEIDCKDAETFGKQMVENSRQIYAGNTDLIPEEPQPVPVDLERFDTEKWLKRNHFYLIYDQSKCLYPKCRLCMDFCPINGIDLTVEPRIVGQPCQTCSMCDQLCPTGAITIDPIQMRWQASNHDYERTGRQRLAQLKEGIKQEERRRPTSPYGPFNTKQYLTDEEVAEGYLHQVYKVYNKRPRFIIGYGRPYGIDPRTLEDRGPAPENWPE